jgi:hypothetical protein
MVTRRTFLAGAAGLATAGSAYRLQAGLLLEASIPGLCRAQIRGLYLSGY